MVAIIISCSIGLVAYAPLRAIAADCPLQLRSIVFGAQSSSHDFVSYAVRMNGPPQTRTNAQLSVRLSDGTHVEVPWSNITIETPSYPGQATSASGWFDRRKSDVAAAVVDAVSPEPGQSPVPCTGVEVALNASDNAPWGFEVLNAQRHVVSSAVTGAPIEHHKNIDADFKSKIAPSYPAAEMKSGVEGDVTVRITVGVDGQVTRAVIEESSQDDDIDLAALDAARRSTFRPATIDGVPTAEDYLVIYTFRAGGELGAIGFTGYSVPKSNCPLAATSMKLVNAGGNKRPDWYSMDFSATRTDIVSAEIEFYDAALTYVMVPWDSITVEPLDKDGTSRVAATIPWTGDDPLKFWVASVKYADGHSQECSTYYELVDRPDAAGPLPRTLKPTPLTVRVETRRYEAPLFASYPIYPGASLAKDVTGDVGVDALVDDAGNVTGALVVSSSKSEDLDDAALSAAMKTKFAPHHDTGYFPIRVYHLDYEFEDNIW